MIFNCSPSKFKKISEFTVTTQIGDTPTGEYLVTDSLNIKGGYGVGVSVSENTLQIGIDEATFPVDFPEFKHIGASEDPDTPDVPDTPEEPDTPVTPEEPDEPIATEEYNLITLATEVSTFDELKAFDGIAILRDHQHKGKYGFDAKPEYDVIKVPVSAGDVIRSKLASFWGDENKNLTFYYAAFYDASGTVFPDGIYVTMGGHAEPTYLDIRENGVTIPEGCAYVLVNIYWKYAEHGDGHVFGSTENGKTAEIITKNADPSLTAYDGTHKVEDYVPVAERIPEQEYPDATGEYNLITLAEEVGTLEELHSHNGVAILKGYRHEYSSAVANENYNLLRIPVKPGDVIRDKLATWWRKPAYGSSLYYYAFYNASGSIIGGYCEGIKWDGNASPNYLAIRENGITAPANSSYVILNINRQYEPVEDVWYRNGFTANIITKNLDPSLTAYDGLQAAPEYIPMAERSALAVYGLRSNIEEEYYEAVDDVRIPRYESKLEEVNESIEYITASLTDIETVLESVVGGVE